MPEGYREEVFNVLLAQLLDRRSVVTAPERAISQLVEGRRHRRLPDVMVVYQGLRTVIEGKVEGQPQAREKALAQARDRVEKGIAQIGVAVIYPATLRGMQFDLLLDALAQARLQVATYSEAGEQAWTEGNVNYLTELLRRTFDQLVKEDVVKAAVDTLDAGVTSFARAVFTMPATSERAAAILGIGKPPTRSPRQADNTADDIVDE